MALSVYKFGGTSLSSIEHIKRVAKTVATAWKDGEQIVVVLSAMGNSTDKLVELAKSADPNACGPEFDALLATGEQVSTAVFALLIKHEHGIDAKSFSGAQAGIATDSAYNKARILNINTSALQAALNAKQMPVVTGFQGINDEGRITTLGRGGSDTSAVALAVALKADKCCIYTDVTGVYTTDPRIVKEARLIKSLTSEEMLEMAGLGAKVLQIRAVQFASKYNMPLHVLSSFESGPGTLIRNDNNSDASTSKSTMKDAKGKDTTGKDAMEKALITGIAFNRDEAQLTITGVPDTPGIAAQILGDVAKENIEVDMIVQNVGVHDNLADFTFTVNRNDYERALSLLQKIAKGLGAEEAFGDNTVVKVSIVGVGMRSHAGVAATMFKVLAENKINISMISTSEIKVSVVIAEEHLEQAVQTLHKAFELEVE